MGVMPWGDIATKVVSAWAYRQIGMEEWCREVDIYNPRVQGFAVALSKLDVEIYECWYPVGAKVTFPMHSTYTTIRALYVYFTYTLYN